MYMLIPTLLVIADPGCAIYSFSSNKLVVCVIVFTRVNFLNGASVFPNSVYVIIDNVSYSTFHYVHSENMLSKLEIHMTIKWEHI